MALDFLLQELANALSGSALGVVFFLAMVAVAAAWRGITLARRRLLLELQIAREMIELQSLGTSAKLDFGLLPSAPLSKATWWQDLAYGWPLGKRIAFWTIFGVLVSTSVAVAGAGLWNVFAGIIVGVGVLALLVILSAVVFVLVSDIGEKAMAEERDGEPKEPGEA